MKIENIINTLPFDGLKTNKLVSNETGSMILVSIEKGKELTAHKSKTDAAVLILEGEVIFKINGEAHTLKVHDMFSFKKEEEHAVEAVSNAKFIVVK
jgi:quercetin dioxygenase-like cupin family protein